MRLDHRLFLLGSLLSGALCVAGCGGDLSHVLNGTVEREVTDRVPPSLRDFGLVHDTLDAKQTSFDSELVDRRPLEGWQVNQSEAVVKLDVPLVQPDSEANLLVLHPSYGAAMRAAQGRSFLASVNMIDAKSKQFDDGLYAAIDLAYFQGVEKKLASHQDMVQRLLAKVNPNGSAAAFLAAGLTLGGRETSATDGQARERWISQFQQKPSLAKPIGFYTWNDSLRRCWAFMRFFQQELQLSDSQQRAVAEELAAAIRGDSSLAEEYEAVLRFFAKLTNPYGRPSLLSVARRSASPSNASRDLPSRADNGSGVVFFFPPSTSRETELFNRLFPSGMPDGANLMRALILAIRSGQVDLQPRENGGWYDRQIYALQTLLLPETGEEHDKLLLTRPYKQKMMGAFAALITKRRETHVRQLGTAKSAAAAPLPQELLTVSPRLRLEPCPSYYVRTARSYAFLSEFLRASLGEELLKGLRGLRSSGERPGDLATELVEQRDRFYGLYLLSCEDIGHRPNLQSGEAADADACRQTALAWLDTLQGDVDLAEDTRVAVPIHFDFQKKRTRLWLTAGVRLTKFEANFVRAPRIRPVGDEGEWKTVEMEKLRPVTHLIAVDEFAEVELPSLSPPTREELRALCDKHRTKEAILQALTAG